MTAAAEIVALGASNTAGYGVGSALAYPAVVQELLRARGLTVTVHNAGISGSTTSQMLSRLEALLTPATRVALFQPGSNDERLGIPAKVREDNIVVITKALLSRGIDVIRVAEAFAAAREGNLQDDGVHYTANGHRRIAELLVDQVAAALSRGDHRSA